MKILKSVLSASLMLVTLSGCAIFAGSGDGEIIYGEALVDDVTIEIMESFPVQVRAVAVGNLQDACTSIDAVEKTRMGNRFEITVQTVRPADMSCAQVLTPFERVIELDVYGLSAGTYTVDVNGVTETFVLEVDNVPPGINKQIQH